MKLLHKLENENIINHYFIVEYNNIRYLRKHNIKTNVVVWSITLEQNDKTQKLYDFDMDDKDLEFNFTQLYRKYKFQRLIK